MSLLRELAAPLTQAQAQPMASAEAPTTSAAAAALVTPLPLACAQRRPTPAPPPVTRVTRVISSATYTRRLFVTHQLSAVLGVRAPPRPPTVRRRACPGQALPPLRSDADPLPDVPLAVVDAAGRVWRLSFSPRRLSPATGRLTGGWAAFCAAHSVRVGDAVVFEKVDADDAGGPTARVTVERGDDGDAAAGLAALKNDE